ncbi:DUF6364 family protein [Flavihumibacter sp. UBA7668]|uniref:DUF6364 family protein n=1 Tax=Flavihumibacter sp. UBA7668 TaxID=1946542 RepID=UPI0025B903B5|nr:DUF6364 family protein [Flavihumibacter sp. UBA7668]
MSTKLTLTIDKEIIESAKRYAQSKGRSLSDLVENYLKSLSGNKSGQNEISPRIRRLMGAVKLPENLDYKEELAKSLEEKYR